MNAGGHASETAALPHAARWHYDVFGFLNGQFGLAIAARNTLAALTSSGRDVRALTVEHNPKRRTSSSRDDHGAVSGEHVRRISVFHVNPVELARYARQWQPTADPRAHPVCVPFWELPLVPRSWERVLRSVSLILAPTRFIEAACIAVAGRDRVLHYPQAVLLPAEVRPARERWGLPNEATIFAVAFDILSDIERKNPWAALDAFRHAFPFDRDVRLVIKTKPFLSDPQLRPYVAKLKARVAGDARIRIIDAELSYEDVLSLYASCDALISLHRSEGLGLHLMEAMSLGLVVVATNWSGCTDYLTTKNSVPIGYDLVPIAPVHDAYAAEVHRPGQVWAEPRIGEAAEALRCLRGDRAYRIARGQRASRDMAIRRKEMLRGGTFETLEAKLVAAPPVDSRFSAAVRSTAVALHARHLQATVRSIPARVTSALRDRLMHTIR